MEIPSDSVFCEQCGGEVAAPAQSASRNNSFAVSQEDPENAEKDVTRIAALSPDELAKKMAAANRKLSLHGERRIVTILFCDIVGSTAAASQLDPENWAEIMNRAFDQMIAPVYTFEGTVARLMGDAILAFFGAPIAHEDDPLRAVRAGLEIVRRFRSFSEEIQAEWGIEINARVGINTGLVLVGRPWRSYRLGAAKLGIRGRWRSERIWSRYSRRRRRPREDLFGIAGISVHTRWRASAVISSFTYIST